MNDGKKILEIQNTEKCIILLAAQRNMYSAAKTITRVWTLLSLFVPVVLTGVQCFLIINEGLLFIIGLATSIIGVVLPISISQLCKNAAKTQQSFDSKVFGINFDNNQSNEKLINKYAKKYLRNNQNHKLLLDWYTVPIEELTAAEAIASCQTQNTCWTKNLGIRYLLFGFLVAVAMITVAIIIIAKKDTDWLSLSFLIPIIIWFLTQLITGISSLKSAKKLECDISHYKLYSKTSIIQVQNDIFEYRCSTFLVPDWFYKHFESRDNKKSIN